METGGHVSFCYPGMMRDDPAHQLRKPPGHIIHQGPDREGQLLQKEGARNTELIDEAHDQTVTLRNTCTLIAVTTITRTASTVICSEGKDPALTARIASIA